MKLQLFFIFSLCTPLISFSASAKGSLCDKTHRQSNSAKSMVSMLDYYNGPVKSVITSSQLPDEGRFKAFKGEAQFDECGSLMLYDFSTQEYIHEHIETNLLRMSVPYDIKFKYQLKNRHRTHTLYLHTLYHENDQNQLTHKVSNFYDEHGKLMGSETSQFSYSDNKITSETVIKSDTENLGNTIYFHYDKQDRLLKTVENNEITLEFNYGSDGKVLHQTQLFSSLYDDIREYDQTCREWDKYNNCLTWDLISTIKQNGELIDTSKATIYNRFEYYEEVNLN
ncbi:hypothetical protein [Proteus vulgaris]|uniref:YD repeat-containing protein n=1 Tax=Proteus vulgaris TaxID=585 RepID=A0A6G6SJ36_PROVU|nr:hypothetical protein [Proteus vulgaris]QIF94545.1 hypothetical protein GTH24_11810 [Proteus vulgaris]WIF70711.1 hypothetical protein QN092_11975 [Proteus vulgaris]